MIAPRLHPLIGLATSLLSFAAQRAFAFSPTSNENVRVRVLYWGQNSYGATHTSDTANWQQPVDFYCQDDSIDAFPIAFLNVFFGAGGLPSIDLANTCNINDDAVFSGTQLPNCQFLASAIETCQSKGKIVTISLGGATGAAGFTSDAQATQFANTIWNVFLGGSSSTRPFGGAVLDGVDLDIEGGSTEYFTTFVSALRSLMDGGSKPYYITGAPQCPFPDAYLGSVINAVGFDAVYVQFYNNYCGLNNYNDANDWNFATWDNWAKTTSPNKNVKVYIGAPASSTAAGSGYVDIDTLTTILQQTKAQYSSFGGVMLWDASQAYANGRFDAACKSALTGGSSAPPPPPPSTTTSTAPTTTTSAPPPPASGGSCAGVNTWVSNVAYNGGDQVVYSGDLWTAKWWSYGDVPGGTAGDWTNDGACTSNNLKAGQYIAYHYEQKSVPTKVPVETPSSVPKTKNSRVYSF
ncbi:glycoside hydrolase family 18 protein [Phanerochaete carnosa HHB-10118-sp]|uniref:chitinase n=1 Tax=Phanerochaete carnosa (strain HHB-10118-sp) TaxID=650164 RepID=K5WGG7_PHACS|nr:glycoside hydrolase family 18 protein [Phanerochaete carnosa HHB-10118-sp]EKM58395.1 glycoside hydrolase family 18 protein [Phanerochaete carnosa HHB-10118-sp]